jgi:hypothetical protein
MKKGNATTRTPDYNRLAEKALNLAIAKLIEERARSGGSLVVWQDGRVISVPASELIRSPSSARSPTTPSAKRPTSARR